MVRSSPCGIIAWKGDEKFAGRFWGRVTSDNAGMERRWQLPGFQMTLERYLSPMCSSHTPCHPESRSFQPNAGIADVLHSVAVCAGLKGGHTVRLWLWHPCQDEALAVQTVRADSSKPEKAPWLRGGELRPSERSWFSPMCFQANTTVKEADGDEEASRQAVELQKQGKTEDTPAAWAFDRRALSVFPTQEPPVDVEPPLKKAKRVPWQWKS